MTEEDAGPEDSNEEESSEDDDEEDAVAAELRCAMTDDVHGGTGGQNTLGEHA